MLTAPRALAVTAAVLLAGCESTFPEDLVTFCRVVGEVDGQAGLTAAAKLEQIEARRPEYARYGLLETRDIWAEAAQQKGEDKYRYLVAAAKKLKAPEWRCPAYATLLNIAAVDALSGASSGARDRPVEGAAVLGAAALAPAAQPGPAASVAAADKAEKSSDDVPPKKSRTKARAKRSRATKTRS